MPAKAATLEDIERLIKDFRKGAENVKAAGFDGVELHGAHGYLVDQFLRDSVNNRTDAYGGSIPNRARFCLEALDQLIEVFGPQRVGIKLSPVCDFNDIRDSDPLALMDYLIEQFNERQIAFLEVNEAFTFGGNNEELKAKFYADRE